MNLNEQLKLKIALEEQFRREVRALFNRIRIEFRIGVSTGVRIRAEKYLPQWRVLLETHYRRVQNRFMGVVKDNIKQIDNVEDLVLAALIAWAEVNTFDSSNVITKTTQNNMDDAIAQARQAFSDEGTVDYTNPELALVSAAILGRKFRGREQSIIMTETQKAAESTKLIEAFAVAGLQPMAVVTREQVPETESIKEWQDMEDKLVRTGHHARQVVPVAIDKPYIVNGQQMMYPSDSSRGATVKNTINCRCASFYIFNSTL